MLWQISGNAKQGEWGCCSVLACCYFMTASEVFDCIKTKLGSLLSVFGSFLAKWSRWFLFMNEALLVLFVMFWQKMSFLSSHKQGQVRFGSWWVLPGSFLFCWSFLFDRLEECKWFSCCRVLACSCNFGLMNRWSKQCKARFSLLWVFFLFFSKKMKKPLLFCCWFCNVFGPFEFDRFFARMLKPSGWVKSAVCCFG